MFILLLIKHFFRILMNKKFQTHLYFVSINKYVNLLIVSIIVVLYFPKYCL